MTATLVSIPSSPWSIRAKLALDVMGIELSVVTYVPTLSTPWLRWKLRRPVGPLTLPVLLWDGPPLTDSMDIVRWGCERSECPLIEPDTLGAVTHWAAVAERLLAAGRIRTTHRVLGDPQALGESLPPAVRQLGVLGLAAGRREAKRLLRKYGDGSGAAAQAARMRAELRVITEALGGRGTMLEEFSYADIVLATALSFVKPHSSHPLGPAARVCWSADELAEEFVELVAWRDQVYAEVERRRSR